jgi:hypothetical protein
LLVSLVLVLNLVMLVVLLFFALRPLGLPIVSALRLTFPFASSSSSSSSSPPSPSRRRFVEGGRGVE